jgi:hypothetical protein
MVELHRALSLALAFSAAGLNYCNLCLYQFSKPQVLYAAYRSGAPWSSSNPLIDLKLNRQRRVEARRSRFRVDACFVDTQLSLPLVDTQIVLHH